MAFLTDFHELPKERFVSHTREKTRIEIPCFGQVDVHGNVIDVVELRPYVIEVALVRL